MRAQLEHANFTVSDPAATANWMREVFGWHLRWEGDAMAGGHTKHVGTEAHYVALYNPGNAGTLMNTSYETIGALNHIAVVVDDLDAMIEQIKAEGVEMEGEPMTESYGKFAWIMDPDGRKVELWEPIEAQPAT